MTKYYSKVECTKKTYNRLKATSVSGRIHSIFNHTMNIIDDTGTLYTIVDDTLNNGPNCIKVYGIEWSAFYFKKIEKVTFENNQLSIGNQLIIDYQNPVFYQESPLIYPLMNDYIYYTIQTIKSSSWYSNYEQKNQEKIFTKNVDDLIFEHSKLLVESIKKNEKCEEQKEILEKFIGLGIGLTPSGDDFLTGLAYVSALENYPNEKIKKILQSLEQKIKEKTNLISYQQFKFALVQEVRTEIRESLSSILSVQSKEFSQDKITNILKIGSTSGFDILRGMLFGLEISLL